MRRILTTAPDGRVLVTCPAPQIFPWLHSGGFFGSRPPRGLLAQQIEGGIADGRNADAQARLVHALAFGGCNTAEAYALIRDRDCAHCGTGHALVDLEDLPDRWFRNAWRRSHNGGPISINLRAAKAVQFSHIKAAIEEENKRRERDLWNEPLAIALDPIKDRIKSASDEAALRVIWPEELDVIYNKQ